MRKPIGSTPYQQRPSGGKGNTMKLDLESLVNTFIKWGVTNLANKVGFAMPKFAVFNANNSMSRQRDPNSQFSTKKREVWLRKKNLEMLHKSYKISNN